MYRFENYTLVVYETPSEYHREIPEHRFLSYVKEIPETSLHAYGSTQDEAIKNLREQYDELSSEIHSTGGTLPPPRSENLEEFSGRIVLRMPPWLHKLVDRLADEEKASTNTYIVNRLIKSSTMEEMFQLFTRKQEGLLQDLSWTFHDEMSEIKPMNKKVWSIGSLAGQTGKPGYDQESLRKAI
jgi:predicted HicB family RNase H-like nuclease